MAPFLLYLLGVSSSAVAGYVVGRIDRKATRALQVGEALAAFRNYSGTWAMIARARVACPSCGATLHKVAPGLLPDPLLVVEQLEALK